MPPTRPAGLNDISGVVATHRRARNPPELVQLGWFGDAPPVTWKPWSEHIRHEHDGVIHTDRTLDDRFITEVSCGTQQLRVSITNLILAQTTASILADECAAGQAVIDDATKLVSVVVGQRQCAQPTLSPSHEPTRYSRHTRLTGVLPTMREDVR
ncbi:MAG: hypothetical protein RIS58_458 [Actinomycetota bacterium]